METLPLFPWTIVHGRDASMADKHSGFKAQRTKALLDSSRCARQWPQWGCQILSCAPQLLHSAVVLFVLAIAASFASPAGAKTHKSDVDALVALRDSQSRAAAASLGWTGADPCSDEWPGVECNRNGRVVALTMSVTFESSLKEKQWSPIESGRIPPQLGNLSALTDLDLTSCYLNGRIPPTIGNLANLKTLILSSNGLSGPLPPQLGNLKNLTQLSLDFNSFSGRLPAELAKLSRLETLDVEGNLFGGPIPAWLERLGSLTDLTLGSNRLSGPIPPQLGNLTRLETLDLSFNNIGGPIPPELGRLASLKYLYLQQANLSGPIPPQLGNLSNLYHFYLQENSLSGPIPPELTNLKSVAVFDLGSNNLNGTIPPSLGSLGGMRSLNLHSNDLSGSIPQQLGKLTQLDALDLSQNNLEGPIPPQLGNLRNMTYLFLSSNHLTGPIPPEVFNIASLETVSMTTNNLSGPIPLPAGRFSNLDLSFNNLTGPIPQILFLDEYEPKLDLSSNRLSGSLPSNISGWPSRTNLVNNFLRGPLPAAARNFTIGLNCFNVSDTNFYVVGERDSQACALYYPELSCGCAPPLVIGSNGSCYCVTPLRFDAVFTCKSSNSLGNFSASLEGTMHDLAAAFGVETRQLSLLTFSTALSSITLSFQILPPGNSLSFSSSEAFLLASVAGAPGFDSKISVPFFDPGIAYLAQRELSHPPPPPSPVQSAPPDANPMNSFARPRSRGNTRLIAGTLAGALFVALLVACIVFWRRGIFRYKPLSGTIKETPVKKWSLAELQSATRNFDPANILGEGGYSTIYKADLGDVLLAVKRLSVQHAKFEEAEFVREVMTIGHIHNRNLLPLQGYCMESGEYLLVYDFMPNGSLEDVLFTREGGNPLPWPTCAKILVGTARAIAYLHGGCKDKIIHRDIKPGNILLDANFVAHVADFGLVRSTQISDTHVSTRVAGTPGYVAPEYASTGQLTEKSDVYSFGVVMLVVISHRRPYDIAEPCSLVERAFEAAVSNRILDLMAPHFLGAYSEEEARRLISVALLCLQPAWQARPSMEEVVQMLCGKADIPAVDIRTAISLPGYASTRDPALSFETDDPESGSDDAGDIDSRESHTGSIRV